MNRTIGDICWISGLIKYSSVDSNHKPESITKSISLHYREPDWEARLQGLPWALSHMHTWAVTPSSMLSLTTKNKVNIHNTGFLALIDLIFGKPSASLMKGAIELQSSSCWLRGKAGALNHQCPELSWPFPGVSGYQSHIPLQELTQLLPNLPVRSKMHSKRESRILNKE